MPPPPLPLPPNASPPRGAPPLSAGVQAGIDAGITSPHGGGSLDLIRTAILSLQHYAEQETDDQELALVHQCILQLQKLLANHAKNQDAAMGTTPAMRHVRRVQGGGNY
jgi:hypothetical protein